MIFPFDLIFLSTTFGIIKPPNLIKREIGDRGNKVGLKGQFIINRLIYNTLQIGYVLFCKGYVSARGYFVFSPF